MYYVIIKKPKTHPPEFMGFKVPKFITKKQSDNVIFEFKIDGKVVRKWINKRDILLVTDDKAFYLKTLERFKKVQQEQEELVQEAKNKLNETIESYAQTKERSTALLSTTKMRIKRELLRSP
jgi:lipopolysaccharide biosynthesis regulator YciM